MNALLLAAFWGGAASAACAFYFNSRALHAAVSGILGAMSWFLYLAVSEKTGSSVAGYFAGTVAVAVSSEVLAAALKNPATVFLLSGLLPLVPGSGVFYMMRAFVQEDIQTAMRTGYETLAAAAAIALGVAVVSSIFRIVQGIFRRKMRTETKSCNLTIE